MDYIKIIKNLRSWDTESFIDCDFWVGEVDGEGYPIEGEGEWLPYTILSSDERIQDILHQCGEVSILRKPRDLDSRLHEAMGKGVPWNGVRLMVDNQNERDRLLSAATRMSINNTLPKNKEVFGYMTADGGYIEIQKDQVTSVAMLVQDYAEDCHDNYIRLLSDESLDEYEGWPE